MRLRYILRYVGIILLLNSGFMFLAAMVSLIYSDAGFFPLLYSSLISALFGVFPMIFVPSTDDISNNEGLIIVIFSWILSCIVGMLPYINYGGEFSVINAFFEAVSGYTTTGATILNDIETLPKGILFWRASTHWIGGVGIIIFVLSVLPSMGVVGMRLYRSEMSAAAMHQFQMRTKEAVKILVYIYLGLTLIETLSLLACGLNLFDAVTHSFATVATGGFSTKNMSIAAFNSPAVEVVIMIFMILSGMNFALLYAVVIGNFASLKVSTVLKYYLSVNLIAILIVTFNTLDSNYSNLIEALRYSSFQILSVGTSTGFANSDSSVWPAASQIILIFFTLQCACAGSTSGGIKIDRIIILFKRIAYKIKKIVHPNLVVKMQLDKKNVDDDLIESSILYISLYLFIVFISSLIVSLLGVDVISAFSGAAAMMGNVGPGVGTVGSLENYSQIPVLGKIVYSITMLLGRLEIYGLVILFNPKIWK